VSDENQSYLPPIEPTGPVSEPAAKPPNRTKTIGAIAVAIVVLAAAGFLGARALRGSSHGAATANGTSSDAQSSQPGGGGGRRPGASGVIQSRSGSTIAITDRSGSSVQVIVTSSTTVSLAEPASLADVKAGDRITATGTSSGSDKLAATQVSDQGSAKDQSANGGGPQGNRRRGNGGTVPYGGQGGSGSQTGFATGTVQKVDAGTITVSSFNGRTSTIDTSSSTTFTKQTLGAASDLKVGQTIRATGSTDSNGTVTATRITEGEIGRPGGQGTGGSGDPSPGGPNGASTSSPTTI